MDPFAQQVFNYAIGTGGVLGLFILKMIFDRIKDAKEAGTEAAATVQEALNAEVERRHQECHALAYEGKSLAVTALDKLNQHRLEVAQNYVSSARLEKLEEALFKKLNAIEDKIDKKADK